MRCCGSNRFEKKRHASRDRFKSGFSRRKTNGWGLNLYRDGKNRRIAGVCAGIAKHFDIEPWVVRVIFFAGLIFFGGLAFFTYIAGWILMAKDSNSEHEVHISMEYNEERHEYQPKKMFKYSSSASSRLRAAKERLNRALRRVETMESYVTSKQYELEKEFSRMNKSAD